MTLHGYGVEFVGHMMLLIVIAGQTQQQKHSTKPVKSMIYHPANCAAQDEIFSDYPAI
jgi:hypothetical protein